jgi:fatty-acyl-CoA synthase
MTPDRVALAHPSRTLTYRQLARRVRQLANALTACGVAPGDRVAYLGPNHPAFVETLFATGSIGATFVPLNTRLAAPELQYMLDDSAAKVLIWDPQMVAVVRDIDPPPSLLHSIPLTANEAAPDDYEQVLAAATTTALDIPVRSDDAAMILYTSGTTGRPKGAVLTHGNITWNTYNVLIDVDVRADEVALVTAPLFHVAALNELFLPTFIKGGTSVLAPAFGPDGVFDLIEQHGVTWIFGVPAMFFAIAQSSRWATADLASLRTVMCGGAPVPLELIKIYQEHGLTFVQGYGMTETGPGALFLRAEQSEAKAGSAGTPCFFTDVRLVGETGATCQVGETGEIQIAGPSVMRGYWQRPAETASSYANEEWFRSGDAARVDADGYFYVVDRIKDVIISGGENIYPAEVEHVLHEHPAVKDCAVIAVDDAKWGQVGKALIIPSDDTADVDDIRKFLRGKLAKYKIPASMIFVEELPRNASGKILRRELRQSHAQVPDNLKAIQ